jgi:uncharacterized protein
MTIDDPLPEATEVSAAPPPDAETPAETPAEPTAEPAPPPPPPEPLRPTSSSERVETIDALRGLALFGILAANIRGFAGPAVTYFTPALFWPALHDRIAQAFIDTFVQGKFIAIFAFLFGVGFAVQFERAAVRSGKFGWAYARRLGVLLLIGLVHGLLIWWGDILLVYAVIGFFLLLFRKRQNKTILIWAIICTLLMPLLMTAMFIGSQLGAEMPKMPKSDPAALAKIDETFSNGAWIDIEKQRAIDATSRNWNFLPAFGWHILSLFLLGMLAWRKGFFSPAPESLSRYRRVMVWALAIGVTGNVAATAIRWIYKPPMMPTNVPGFLAQIIPVIAGPALSLGYICAVILLMQSEAWRARMQRFTAIGRTALTNYLLQSIVGTLIFYSYGLGFFGDVGPAVLLPLTFILFALQAVVSPWWVARYRFGPVEWLWRRMTYGGPLPMRRESPAVAASIPQAAWRAAPPE